jgi:hypothetical protein
MAKTPLPEAIGSLMYAAMSPHALTSRSQSQLFAILGEPGGDSLGGSKAFFAILLGREATR